MTFISSDFQHGDKVRITCDVLRHNETGIVVGFDEDDGLYKVWFEDGETRSFDNWDLELVTDSAEPAHTASPPDALTPDEVAALRLLSAHDYRVEAGRNTIYDTLVTQKMATVTDKRRYWYTYTITAAGSTRRQPERFGIERIERWKIARLPRINYALKLTRSRVDLVMPGC